MTQQVSHNQSILDRLRTKFLPEAVASGAFGDVTFVGFEPSPRQDLDQYMSDIVFGDVILSTSQGRRAESVVVKVHPNTDYAAGFEIGAHFHNEALFYCEIIPFFQKYDGDGFLNASVPGFLYGRATGNPEDDVIILRDVTKEGFRMTEERLFLDEKHIKLALDRLAKFHSLSFKSLHEDPAGFQRLVAKIQTQSVKAPTRPDSKFDFNRLKFRGLEPLKRDPKYADRLPALEKHCEGAIKWMGSLKVHPGPLSVLTRGDCTRNNLMFKYEGNEPCEVVFVDWAVLRYSTLVIDLSVLLTLNTSPEAKRTHWDDYLHTYHSALSRQLQGYPAIPFETLEKEMREKGVYGYYWSVFLLPAALETDAKNRLEALAKDDEAKMRYLMEFGGPQATAYLGEIVKFMFDRNYVFEL
ncbi:unnamed protein product [Bemisia tabaci]|uniref:CHK kinase-like domain-containing protein n=1 Tax=Bemisia tabaci TaxID=7038 RepID=A0A9P0A320_BEMTA|nr:unnamed protein product [Bemisia tabaci]